MMKATLLLFRHLAVRLNFSDEVEHGDLILEFDPHWYTQLTTSQQPEKSHV
jgi:hypothetical protein